jgi:hypothetical protein
MAWRSYWESSREPGLSWAWDVRRSVVGQRSKWPNGTVVAKGGLWRLWDGMRGAGIIGRGHREADSGHARWRVCGSETTCGLALSESRLGRDVLSILMEE